MMAEVESKAKILVVDDDRYSLDLLGDILGSEGYIVEKVSSGEEAIAVSTTDIGRPDLMLLDIMMPGLDGYEVARNLKGNELTKDISIIMVTVLDQPHHKVDGFSLGVDDYITKPFDTSELVARVKSALRAKLLQDQLRSKNQELGRVNEILRSLNVSARTSDQAEVPEDALRAASDDLEKDELTQLYNYPHLKERLEDEFLRSIKFNLPLSYIMVDVDNLKEVNDRFGHAQGDLVLKSVAEFLRKSVRKIDLVARYASDEFAIILPSTEMSDGVSVVEKLVANLNQDGLPGFEGDALVTISVGLAAIPNQEIKVAEQLIKRAEKALYRAKRDGKNRIGLDREAG